MLVRTLLDFNLTCTVNVSTIYKLNSEINWKVSSFQELFYKKLRYVTSCQVLRRHYHRTAIVARQETIMDIFDRNAKMLHKERAAQLLNVADFDYLKEEMGYRLADRVLDIKRKMKVCVDLGSGRGYVTRHLTGHSIEKLYAVDFSPRMLEQCELPAKEENIVTEKILFD